MNNEPHSDEQTSNPRAMHDEAEIERLLREVGARVEPSPEAMQSVRAAVHAEWQTGVAQRMRRKHMMNWSMAASVVIALSGLVLFRFLAEPPPDAVPMATIVKMQNPTSVGNVQVSSNEGATWRDVTLGETLVAGAVVRTDSTTVAALNFGKGLSLRMDVGAHLKIVAAAQVQLERGRIYIDAPVVGQVMNQAPLTVQTAFGAVEHLGTQYQVELAQDRMTVSVREGRVALIGKHSKAQLVTNERVTFGEQGEISRDAIASRDPSWQWAAQAAPTFDIDNRSLASFLDWVARETGRVVMYATPEVRAQAEQLLLRGSVGSLDPDQALRAVLATTQFVHADTDTAIQISY